MPRHIPNCLPIALFALDAQGTVTEWNPACEALTGISAQQVLGTRQAWQAFYPEARPVLAELVLEGCAEAAFTHHYGDRYWRSTTVDGAYEGEGFFPTLGNAGRWLYFTAAPLRDENHRLIGAIETLQDVTEQRRIQETLRQSVAHFRTVSRQDAMTGLFNVGYFREVVSQEVRRASRYARPLSLLMIDIDHFKQINDSFGHAAGDSILRLLAGALQSALRQSDYAFRVGGDEFIILLPETGLETACQIAGRIIDTFPKAQKALVLPCPTCTLSIGLTELAADDTPDTLSERADRALYETKAAGRNGWRTARPAV